MNPNDPSNTSPSQEPSSSTKNNPIQPNINPSPPPQDISPTDAFTQPNPLGSQPVQESYAPDQPAVKSNKNRLLIIAGTLAVALIAVGIVLYLFVFSHHITLKDVSKAQTAASAFNTDVFEATNDINNAQDADKISVVNLNINKANSNLSDAQKQFALLKSSNVQYDNNVKKSFDTLSNKWCPYLTYMQNSIKDTQLLVPPILKYGNQIESLSNSPNSRSDLDSNLTKLKQIISSTTQKIKNIHPVIPEDKNLLSSIKVNLNESSRAIDKARNDLSAGQPSYIIEEDLLSFIDIQNKFIDKVNNIDQQLNKKQDKLSPGHEYNKFADTLDKLYNKLNK